MFVNMTCKYSVLSNHNITVILGFVKIGLLFRSHNKHTHSMVIQKANRTLPWQEGKQVTELKEPCSSQTV